MKLDIRRFDSQMTERMDEGSCFRLSVEFHEEQILPGNENNGSPEQNRKTSQKTIMIVREDDSFGISCIVYSFQGEDRSLIYF